MGGGALPESLLAQELEGAVLMRKTLSDGTQLSDEMLQVGVVCGDDVCGVWHASLRARGGPSAHAQVAQRRCPRVHRRLRWALA